jgi:hypothetical protein
MKSSTKLTTFDRDMGADEPIEAPSPDFDGPVPKSDRRITDPLSILFLLSAWVYFVWVGIWAVRNGNPDAILHPHDYRGRMCGVSMGDDGSLLPPLWAPVDVLGNGMCVADCPGESNFAPADRLDLHCKDDADLLEIEACLGENGEVENDPNVLVVCGGCMFQLETMPGMSNYFCQPKSTMGILDEINNAAARAGHSDSEFLVEYELYQNMPSLWRYVQGIISSKFVLGVGLGGAASIGVTYMLLLQIPSTIAATLWISTFLVPITFSCGGYLLYTMAQEYDFDYSPGVQGVTKPKAIKFAAICIWAASGIIISLIAGRRRRIQHTISIAKAAAESTTHVKEALMSPIIQLLGFILFFLPWSYFLFFLATTLKPVEQTSEIFGGIEITTTSYEYSRRTVNMFWFLVFIFLWTSEFIICMGRITLNAIFAKWYFTPDKEDGIEMSLLSCIWLATRKHFGTAAFGSFVTGPIQLIRFPIIWTQSFIKKFNAKGSCISLLICSCQCCLFSLERFFKFASKDSYVYTSLLGFSFCKGSHTAFYMVGRNADCGAVEGIYNEQNLLFCKLCITAITTTATLLGMDRSGEEFFVVFTVTLTVAIVSWFIAGIFVELCASATLTMLHCYLVDDEVFEHEDVTVFAPQQLLVTLAGGSGEHDDESDDDDDDDHSDEEDVEKGYSEGNHEYVEQGSVAVVVEEEEVTEEYAPSPTASGHRSLVDQMHSETEDDT